LDPTIARTLLGAAFDHLELHEVGDTLQVEDPTIIVYDIAS
jgi:hypothetical protein